jgi:hypothetical protein
MGIHVVKVDKLNHDKNHVVIHVDLLYNNDIPISTESNRKCRENAKFEG